MEGGMKDFLNQKEKPIEEQLSIRNLADHWNVPDSTLRRNVINGSKVAKSKLGRNTTLSAETESELGRHITYLAECGFPLNKKEVQRLAYNVALSRKVKRFNSKKQIAGRYWLKGFLKRQKNIGLKKGHNLSIARAAASNKGEVSQWFVLYTDFVNKLGFIRFA